MHSGVHPILSPEDAVRRLTLAAEMRVVWLGVLERVRADRIALDKVVEEVGRNPTNTATIERLRSEISAREDNALAALAAGEREQEAVLHYLTALAKS